MSIECELRVRSAQVESVGDEDKDPANCIGRRGFLRSIFGLKVAEKYQAAPVEAAVKNFKPIFIWADLKTGQVGFPTGFALGYGLPGSLMKLVAATVLLEKNLLNPNHTVECLGSIVKDHQTFHCKHAHGHVDIVRALAQSCNVFFVRTSELYSAALLLEYASTFGLDRGCANKLAGAFPVKASAPSYMYALGLASDLQPNALQLLRMVSVIATAGDAPFLHSAEESGEGERFQVELKETSWRHLQQAMQLACRDGTAAHLDPTNLMHIAAKTGTSPQGNSFQSWLIGFFPAEQPKHAFVLNSLAGNSQEAAVPLAHQFLFATTWP